MATGPRTILALSSYFKGNRFLQACKAAGWRVYLLTLEAKRHEPWARETLDDVFVMPSFANIRNVIDGLAYLMRTIRIDTLVALDDFDVELGAALRDHFRLGGLDLGTMSYYGLGWNYRPVSETRGTAWHAGYINGTATVLVRRTDDINWAVLFNADLNADDTVLTSLVEGALHDVANKLMAWPEGDLFGKYLK